MLPLRRSRLLLELGKKVLGALDLDPRNQLVAQACDLLDQVPSPLNTVEGPGILAPVLVDAKVRVGGQKQGVVLCRPGYPTAGKRAPAARSSGSK